MTTSSGRSAVSLNNWVCSLRKRAALSPPEVLASLQMSWFLKCFDLWNKLLCPGQKTQSRDTVCTVRWLLGWSCPRGSGGISRLDCKLSLSALEVQSHVIRFTSPHVVRISYVGALFVCSNPPRVAHPAPADSRRRQAAVLSSSSSPQHRPVSNRRNSVICSECLTTPAQNSQISLACLTLLQNRHKLEIKELFWRFYLSLVLWSCYQAEHFYVYGIW